MSLVKEFTFVISKLKLPRNKRQGSIIDPKDSLKIHDINEKYLLRIRSSTLRLLYLSSLLEDAWKANGTNVWHVSQYVLALKVFDEIESSIQELGQTVSINTLSNIVIGGNKK